MIAVLILDPQIDATFHWEDNEKNKAKYPLVRSRPH